MMQPAAADSRYWLQLQYVMTAGAALSKESGYPRFSVYSLYNGKEI